MSLSVFILKFHSFSILVLYHTLSILSFFPLCLRLQKTSSLLSAISCEFNIEFVWARKLIVSRARYHRISTSTAWINQTIGSEWGKKGQLKLEVRKISDLRGQDRSGNFQRNRTEIRCSGFWNLVQFFVSSNLPLDLRVFKYRLKSRSNRVRNFTTGPKISLSRDSERSAHTSIWNPIIIAFHAFFSYKTFV